MTDKERKQIEGMKKVVIENDPIICVQCKDRGTDKCNTANCVRHMFYQNATENLYKANYRKADEVVKEFAEKLKTELFAKCVIIQSIYDTQKEDMNSEEAFQIIDNLAEQYGKEGV